LTVSDLQNAIAQVRERIRRNAGQSIGETNTKNTLIDPILRGLGWDTEELEEVNREYKRRPSDNPVDYALFLLRTPSLFVEAKALGQNLNDPKWANQVISYAVVSGVEWVVLTDGNEWRTYNSHATVPVEEKLFRSIRLDDPEANAEGTLRLLSKAQMREKSIDVLWKAHFVDRQIKAAIEAMFGAEPDRSLVSLLRKRAPSLPPADIRAGLRRLRVRLDFPVEPSASAQSPGASELARAGGPGRQAAPVKPRSVSGGRSPKAPGAGTPWRHISLRDLIDAGLVEPPADIEVSYRGQRLAGQIKTDSKVVWNGETYESLSTAAGMARKSIIGTRPGRAYPQTNGWTFWHIRDAEGNLRALDDLRQWLFESRAR
jgi:hypothetical protein